MLYQEVENLIRHQAFMPEDVDERVAEAECFAGVDLRIRDADRPLYKLRVVRRRITLAVFITADDKDSIA
jgi:hypothetical protein